MYVSGKFEKSNAELEHIRMADEATGDKKKSVRSKPCYRRLPKGDSGPCDNDRHQTGC